MAVDDPLRDVDHLSAVVLRVVAEHGEGVVGWPMIALAADRRKTLDLVQQVSLASRSTPFDDIA